MIGKVWNQPCMFRLMLVVIMDSYEWLLINDYSLKSSPVSSNIDHSGFFFMFDHYLFINIIHIHESLITINNKHSLMSKVTIDKHQTVIIIKLTIINYNIVIIIVH